MWFIGCPRHDRSYISHGCERFLVRRSENVIFSITLAGITEVTPRFMHELIDVQMYRKSSYNTLMLPLSSESRKSYLENMRSDYGVHVLLVKNSNESNEISYEIRMFSGYVSYRNCVL